MGISIQVKQVGGTILALIVLGSLMILSDEVNLGVKIVIAYIIIIVIVILITIYILHTTLGCYVGVHKYKKEGTKYSTPIEHHYVCMKCGKTKTVFLDIKDAILNRLLEKRKEK